MAIRVAYLTCEVPGRLDSVRGLKQPRLVPQGGAMSTQTMEPRLELEQNLHMYRQVAACFFGDGALGQGLLYESMNMASLWKLPVIYVCENNLYGEYTPCGDTIAGEILARARAFGIHAETVDGQDVQAVNATMRKLVERARRGEGPAFIECKTYRYHGHHVGDVNREYRTREEEKEWMSKHDPLETLAQRLTAQRLVDASVFERIQTDVKAEIDTGVQFALAAPYPEANQVDQDVYA